MGSSQFELYVKADSSGKAIGDCPFSLRTLMYSNLKVEDWPSVFKVIPVDFQNKPPEFLKLNPAGTTPVLVDKENGNVISDSGEITKYINDTFPLVDTQHGYEGQAVEAIAGIFGKLVSLLKNSDPSQTAQLKEALTAELRKLETFLASPKHKGKYLLGNNLSELDCSLLPKLKHLLVAGSHYRNYFIPDDMVYIHKYLKNGLESTCFQAVCPPDAEFVHGWKRHGITPDSK
ncbi:chloride intracellular channel protein 5-like isoform X2 [Liolophura sinensis]